MGLGICFACIALLCFALLAACLLDGAYVSYLWVELPGRASSDSSESALGQISCDEEDAYVFVCGVGHVRWCQPSGASEPMHEIGANEGEE